MGKVFQGRSRRTFWKHLGTVSIQKQNYFYRTVIQLKIGKKLIERLMKLLQIFAIPAWSPDLNPIENIFNRIREKSTEDAIVSQIKRRNFKEFSASIKRAFAEFPVEEMVKTIDSIQKRMKLVAMSFGKITKYWYWGFTSISEKAFLVCF